MRIRSTKPEFWRSRRISGVDWDARLVLKGLESYVDDNGVGKNDIALIVSDIFPRDFTLEPSRVLKRVQVAMDSLSEAGLLHRYTVDGTDLLYISFWEQAQYINRPSKGRSPRPDGTFEYGESQIGAPLLRAQEDVLSPQPLNREQGTGEQENSHSVADATVSDLTPTRFDEFWDVYGKKVGKPKARAEYRKALKKTGVTEELLIGAAAKYVAYCKAEGKYPQYAKDPERWLKGEHWTDELPAPKASGQTEWWLK